MGVTWSPQTGLTRLDDLVPGWQFWSAIAINDRGQIVVEGWNSLDMAGVTYAGPVLLTPAPEPATAGPLCVGLTAILLIVRAPRRAVGRRAA